MSLVRLCIEGYHVEPEYYDRVKEIWQEFDPENKWRSLDEVLLDIEEIPEWVAVCKGLYIKPLKRVRFERPPQFTLSANSNGTKEFLKTVNQIVMPGFELLQYGYIEVMNDPCTNSVNAKLKEGFRIIAVLPQPGQRRPDYVLVRKEQP